MHAQTQFRPAIIEALTALWRALPLRNVSDEVGTMDDYCFALADLSPQAVWNTVNDLRAGKIEEASKDFCPKAPKLAEYARAEQRRLDAVKRPRMISYEPQGQPFKDWRIVQRQRTAQLSIAGFSMIADEIGIDDFTIKARRRIFPAGTLWFWALQEAWAPMTGEISNATAERA